MKKYMVLVFAFFIFGCDENSPVDPDPPSVPDTDQVTFVSRTSGSYLGRAATVLELLVKSADLSVARTVNVRILKPLNTSRGTLILASGGYGNVYYGIGYETNATLNFALSTGLETMEIRWSDSKGWGTGTAGIGYPKAVRAFGAVIRYLKKNEMSNTALVIAHGGSGGSFQIAYGLAYYNLEMDIDHAILVAGPPTSSLQQAIFGEKGIKSYWPDGLGGFAITDYIHGWENNGDYCKNRNRNPPNFVLEALDQSSLLSKKNTPDLSYRTRMFFLNTNDVTNADGQGRLFFDAIQSSKEWHYLPFETSHDVPGIPEGAKKIREIIEGIL